MLNLSAYRLHGTNLSNADFRNAFLVGVTLDYVDCCFTDFTGADLRGADIRKAFVKLNLWAQIYEYHLAHKLYTDSIFSLFILFLSIVHFFIQNNSRTKELFIRVTSGVLPPRLTRRDFKLFPDKRRSESCRFRTFSYMFPQIF